MQQEVIQVKFSKIYNDQNVSVICTQGSIYKPWWDCTFSGETSLLNISHFAVDLFNCATLSGAEILTLRFGNHAISIEKCPENNTFTHYLEKIASKLKF